MRSSSPASSTRRVISCSRFVWAKISFHSGGDREALPPLFDQMDVRPGGTWRFVQRDPDGNEFAFNGVYHSIVPPERVVDTFEFEGMPDHVLLETVTFEEHEGKTKLTNRSVFQTVEDRNGALQSGMEAGAAETMDRLGELLKEIQK
jgi:uncharacterized protein YndB with AHSA1/START domain